MNDELGTPRLLKSEDSVSEFDCGEPELDLWLKKRALQNDLSGASWTFVIAAGDRVIGYYALAVGAVTREAATGRVRRNMPDPIPIMVLARLAIDRRHKGQGLGTALLRDALLRTVQASEIAGIRAVLLHAISESSKRWYLDHGFSESPVDPMTLMVTIADLKASLGG